MQLGEGRWRIARGDEDHRAAGHGVFELTGEKILASFGRNAGMFFSTARSTLELPGCGVVEFFLVRPDGAGRRDPQRLGRLWDAVDREPYGPISLRAGRGHCRLSEFHRNRAAADLLVRAFRRHSARVRGGDHGASSRRRRPNRRRCALRLSDAQMREEALRAYLHETARAWRPGAGPAYAARALRTKTYVTQEATRLCAELFALSGGRHYTATAVSPGRSPRHSPGPRCARRCRSPSIRCCSSSRQIDR